MKTCDKCPARRKWNETLKEAELMRIEAIKLLEHILLFLEKATEGNLKIAYQQKIAELRCGSPVITLKKKESEVK